MVAKLPLGTRGHDASDIQLQQAAHAMHAGRLVEAERIASELLKKNPTDARAAHIYGHSLYMQGRGHDAIIALERAARQNHSPVLDTQLGMLLRQIGNIDDSLKYFERAIKRATPFPPAFLEYGSLLIEMIRYDEAVDVLEHGLALAPDFAEILVHLGYAHAARGDRNKAVELFSRAIRAAPNDPETIFNLACLMKNACCFAQAAELFKRMLSLQPNNSRGLVGLGICRLELNETEAGFANLRAAARVDARIFGQVVSALASAGQGRFWLMPSAARRFLKEEGA